MDSSPLPPPKPLPINVAIDIRLKNQARKECGLKPIEIKVRKCLACGFRFESAGNRTCGCVARSRASGDE